MAMPGQVEPGDRPRALAAQLGVHAALHDPEERLPALVPGVRREAALQPGQGAAHAAARERLVGRERRALVEGHHDVGAERVLDLDGALGREVHLAPVDLVLEAHAAVRDLLAGGARRPGSRRCRSGSARPSA